jgi:hypothetical protein
MKWKKILIALLVAVLAVNIANAVYTRFMWCEQGFPKEPNNIYKETVEWADLNNCPFRRNDLKYDPKVFLHNATCTEISCVDPFDNSCKPAGVGWYNVPAKHWHLYGKAYKLNYTGNDKIAFCNPGGRWVDCDKDNKDRRCAQCTKAQGWSSGCKGEQCWTKAGELGVGEYTDLTTKECCGDDANEYFRCNPNNPADCACCKSKQSTVINGRCV